MPPPRIIEHPTNVQLSVTDTALLMCVGQGYGLVNVTWVRKVRSDERPPRSKSTVTTMVTPKSITTITSILTIPDLEYRDERDYRCIYSNSGGVTYSDNATLTIRSKN